MTMHDLGNERIVNTYTRAAGEFFPVKCLNAKDEGNESQNMMRSKHGIMVGEDHVRLRKGL